MPGLNFVAIDFETANAQPDSACQLAAVVVENGEFTQRCEWLIRPQPLYFSPMNIQIHGITPLEVASAPQFSEIWPEVAPLVSGRLVIAHNVFFDLGVLRACLAAANLEPPECWFTCSRMVARRTWPEFGRFGLKTVADQLGIRFKHHDALEDADTCARIVIAAAQQKQAESLKDLLARLTMSAGQIGKFGIRRFDRPTPRSSARQRSRTQNQAAQIGSTPIQELWTRGQKSKPLAGQSIVFTGHLDALPREDAESFARDLGAFVQSRVTETTNAVVIGRTDQRTLRSGSFKSSKQRPEALKANGRPIEILNEGQFIDRVRELLPELQRPNEVR